MRSETALATLAGLAIADAVPVALRQIDMIKRLPDVPWRGFDANQVTTSPEAHPFGIPDALLATGLYLGELGLLAWRRRRPSRLVDVALGAFVAGGAIAAGYYAVKMVTVEKRACVYCIGAIAIHLAMVPLAWRALGRRR
jgi:uncharacterized membrane protein